MVWWVGATLLDAVVDFGFRGLLAVVVVVTGLLRLLCDIIVAVLCLLVGLG